jgi:poly-gamma-glutamate synthesis protein (capsule biosynthesis protein)
MNLLWTRMPGVILASLLMLVMAPESTPVTLALVGDLMIGRGVSAFVHCENSEEIFAALTPWLRTADVAFGNLESPISAELPRSSGSYNLCASPAGLGVLKTAGFDLLSTANNHSRDCLESGEESRPETQTHAWISSAGLRAVDDSFQPVEIRVRGKRLVFLAADDISAPVDMPGLTAAVSKARASGAVVVVSMHWGLEYQAGQTRRQSKLARELADAGASLIVGHHPHVTQPVECLNRSGSGEPTLVFYSLGNALFDQHGLPDTRRGRMAFVRIFPNGVMQSAAIPFEIKPHQSGYQLIPGPVNPDSCSGIEDR